MKYFLTRQMLDNTKEQQAKKHIWTDVNVKQQIKAFDHLWLVPFMIIPNRSFEISSNKNIHTKITKPIYQSHRALTSCEDV